MGDYGEDKAADYLSGLGYSIVARNFRSRRGELDIVASKEDFLVFVEVKTLPGGDCDVLSHELNLKKQRRIIETSKFFLLNHRQYNNSKIRYDVIVVDMPGFDSVYHIQDAFSELV